MPAVNVKFFIFIHVITYFKCNHMNNVNNKLGIRLSKKSIFQVTLWSSFQDNLSSVNQICPRYQSSAVTNISLVHCRITFSIYHKPPSLPYLNSQISNNNQFPCHYISHESQTTRNVLWSRMSVCLSVHGRMPTLLHRPGCDLGEWQGVPPSCALLGGFAIGARVALLWQTQCEREMLASTCLYSLYVQFLVNTNLLIIHTSFYHSRSFPETDHTP